MERVGRRLWLSNRKIHRSFDCVVAFAPTPLRMTSKGECVVDPDKLRLDNCNQRYWLTTFSSCGAMNISLNKSKAPTTMALSAMLKAGQ
jgi:hypothetical protein